MTRPSIVGSLVASERERRAAAIVALPGQWRRDARRYPRDLRAQLEADAIRACATELDNVLAGRARDDPGTGRIRTVTVHDPWLRRLLSTVRAPR